MNTKDFLPFDELLEKILSDPDVKKHYDELESEDLLIRAVLDKRLAKKMSQAELARRMGTKQSAISRLESGGSNPSFKFLQKVAKALDSKLHISFQ